MRQTKDYKVKFSQKKKGKPADLKLVHDRLKAKWALLFPLKQFNGFYQDEVAAEAFQVTASIAFVDGAVNFGKGHACAKGGG
jgi:hypothetical protein